MAHDLAGSNAPADHLHSHLGEPDASADLAALAAQFIDGFCTAQDKAAYLTLAGIPREIDDEAGGAPLKLVDVQLRTDWQVGTASPAFGTRELSYLAFPGERIQERTNMAFVYVSLDRRAEVDLRRFLSARLER
ncbi:MAG: hypothetical protein AAGI34_07695 [Pseudomonadota bacterium]